MSGSRVTSPSYKHPYRCAIVSPGRSRRGRRRRILRRRAAAAGQSLQEYLLAQLSLAGDCAASGSSLPSWWISRCSRPCGAPLAEADWTNGAPARPWKMGGGRWIWCGLGSDAPFLDAELSGSGVQARCHGERRCPVAEVQAALLEAGLVLVGGMGQREEDGELIIVDDWDEEHDHKIVHVARRR